MPLPWEAAAPLVGLAPMAGRHRRGHARALL